MAEGLSGLTVDGLKWRARALPGGLPTRKAELADLLVKTLSNPAEVRRLWGLLAPVERQVIAEVVHNLDGLYDSDRIKAKYPELSSQPRVGYYGSRSDAEARLFDLFFYQHSEEGTFVPREIASTVLSIAAKPGPVQLAGSEDPPTSKASPGDSGPPPEVLLSDAERAVFPDLAATLHMIDAGKISVGGTTKLPTLGSVRQLRARLVGDDYFKGQDYAKAEDAMRSLAFVVFVQAAKWATAGGAQGSTLRLTKSGQALLGKPLQAEHIRDAWDGWLGSDILDELSRIRNVKGQQSRRTHLTEPDERRDELADALGECPVGRWVQLDDFFRFMRAEGFDPKVERSDHTGLYVGYSAEYGWLGYADVEYWNIVVGSYLRALLMEYAATLGLVEIAYTRPEATPWQFGSLYGGDEIEYMSRYDGLLGFRLTNLGAFVLGLTEEYAPPAPAVGGAKPTLKILPNLDLVIVDAKAVSFNERALLERLGVEQSRDVYRLNRDKLIEAGEHGLSIAQAAEFLCALSGLAEAELPQPVTAFLADVQKRLGALREAGRALILEADDPLLLTELAHSASLRSVVRVASVGGKTVLLVPEKQEAAARRQLKKLGYLPRKGI